MNKFFIVAKFEYLRTVKRLAFWFTTLIMPVFFGVIIFVSGYSSLQVEEFITKLSESIENIQIVDDSGLIIKDFVQAPSTLVSNFDEALQKVKNNESDLLIYYPSDFAQTGTFKIFAQKQDGLFTEGSFEEYGRTLARQSVVTRIPDETLRNAINQNFTSELELYNSSGNIAQSGLEILILPAISLIIFFLAVFISANFLLQSVSEEKENRMVEFILSLIRDEVLIYGKIIGLSGVVITQLIVWIVGAAVVYLIGQQYLNIEIAIDLSQFSLVTIFSNIYFVITGFLLFAAIMVGVGAVGTSYKDSQNLSSVFIILSVFPLYFISYIFSQPNGPISIIASLFPLTSPMMFLIRNSMGALSTPELLFGMILVLIYVVLAFILASKLFNVGALMYSRKPTVREILHSLKK